MACATLLRIATMCGIYYVNNPLKQGNPVLSSHNVVGITYSNHVTLFNNMEFLPCFVNRSNPVVSQPSQQFFLNNDHPVIYNKNLVFYDVEKDDHLKMIRVMKQKEKELEQEEKRRIAIQDKFEDYRKDVQADSKRTSMRFRKEQHRREKVEKALVELKKNKATSDAIKNQLLAKERARYHELDQKFTHLQEEKKKHAIDRMKELQAEHKRRATIEKALALLKKRKAEFAASKKKLLAEEKAKYIILSHKLKNLEREKARHDTEQASRLQHLEKERNDVQKELDHVKKNMEVYKISNEKLFHKEKARHDDLVQRLKDLQEQKKKSDVAMKQKIHNEEHKRVVIEKALIRLRKIRKHRERRLRRRIRKERELREELEERLRKILAIQENMCEDHHEKDHE